MFKNKNLELASYGHLDFYYFQSFLKEFPNASLMNSYGDLLFSNDDDQSLPTTTSRLVVFQIAQKYLKLNAGDVFIINDPENGGSIHQRLFFVSCFTDNLFLVWCVENASIQIKIPLTPILEKGLINQAIFLAITETCTDKLKFQKILNEEFNKFKNCLNAIPFLTFLSEPDLQKLWLHTCLNEFNYQFDLKAHGQSESQLILFDKMIKFKLTIEEKQNQKIIICDFSNTNSIGINIEKDPIHIASHVLESALIFEMVGFFKLKGFLSQTILNSLKIIVPPKSIVSKPNPFGLYNFAFQTLIRQNFINNIININTPTRSLSSKKAEMHSAAYVIIQNQSSSTTLKLSGNYMQLNELHSFFNILEMHNIDHKYTIKLKTKTNQKIKFIFYFYQCPDQLKSHFFELNNLRIQNGFYELNDGDLLNIFWQIK